MEKYILTIEFRYNEVPKIESTSGYKTETLTIGVYETFEAAADDGNKQLEIMEGKFKLNPHHNKKERFSKNGGAFGGKRDLITNLGYLCTPFSFFAKIETLKFGDLSDKLYSINKACLDYQNFKNKQNEY